MAFTSGLSEQTLIELGLMQGFSYVNKFGRNLDVDTATVPEDVWNGGASYTGFPLGSPEQLQFFSSSASDTGVVTFLYLASATATEYSTGTVTLTGTTPVNSGITAYRVHTAWYNSGSATNFNVGEITCRHITTTANVFFVMPIGTSQTYSSGYTVPFGCNGYILKLFGKLQGATSGVMECCLWLRQSGVSPRLRRPFLVTNGDGYMEEPKGGLMVGPLTDIIVRVNSASANNLGIIAGYDILLDKI